MQELRQLNRALSFAFFVFTIVAYVLWYCELPAPAVLFAGLAAISVIALSALGWTRAWDALENGKIPW